MSFYFKQIRVKHLVIYLVASRFFIAVLLWLEGAYGLEIYEVGYVVDFIAVVALIYLPIKMIMEIRGASKEQSKENN